MPSRADYERFFREADTDGSGTLTIDELLAVLKKRGYSGSDRDIKAMFRSADTSGDGELSLEEFLQAMGAVPPSVHGSALARNCFKEFDKNGDGVISRAELKQVFKEMGKHFSEAELDRMMKVCDVNGDGEISYEEFVQKIFGGGR